MAYLNTTTRPGARTILLGLVLAISVSACGDDRTGPVVRVDEPDVTGAELDAELQTRLAANGIDGRLEEQLEVRLGRPVNPELAEVGRLLFFDRVLSLTQDNSCAGCHGPNVAFNDAVSISIGVDNNLVVGEDREGPHNRRRAPTVLNAAFYPTLMWEGRFRSEALDPFDNSMGFTMPEPEGTELSRLSHLLAAQSFTPVADRSEMAGFDFPGTSDDIRAEIARRVDAIPEYRERFGTIYPAIADGASITYDHIAESLAEFQLTLVRADAPIDAYARGDTSALTPAQKRGANLFLGTKTDCFECHVTIGYASQLFSDFDEHNIGVPQIAPVTGNMAFDGPGENEDFGLERITGDPDDRYEFRTSPLRNVAYQPSFMHNGAYLCLTDAVRHHLDVYDMLESYNNTVLPPSLRAEMGPAEPVLDRLHILSANPPELSEEEISDLVAFMHALSDPDAAPDRLASLIPATVPSGLPLQDFQFTRPAPVCQEGTGSRPGR